MLKLNLFGSMPNAEIVHYYDGESLISSWHRRVRVHTVERELPIILPRVGLDVFGSFRLFRRAMRLDKCNVVPIGDKGDELLIVRQNVAYHYESATGRLERTLYLKNCRQMLHQAIARVGECEIFMGEYGANPSRAEVPVYRSRDGGRSWKVVYTFPQGSIKHVHGCYWDPWWERIWVLTGDFNGECWMLVADRDFRELQWLGDGTQVWRAVNVFFEQDRVVWLMDSQLEESRVVMLDRNTGNVFQGIGLPGPVWYIKRLKGGGYLAGTACETGPGVKDEYAHLLYSSDLEHWREVARFAHDGLPKRYFKNGVIGFADGEQTADDFVVFGEALRGLDGKAMKASLTSIE